MTNSRCSVTFVMTMAIAALGSTALADPDDEKLKQVKALEQQCESTRAEHLAPIRQKLAAECMHERREMSDAEQPCTIETSTYGNNSVNAAGAVMKGLYYDIPECVAAEQAWQEWKDAQPWR